MYTVVVKREILTDGSFAFNVVLADAGDSNGVIFPCGDVSAANRLAKELTNSLKVEFHVSTTYYLEATCKWCNYSIKATELECDNCSKVRTAIENNPGLVEWMVAKLKAETK